MTDAQFDPRYIAEIERQLLGYCMGPKPGVYQEIDWSKITITDPVCAIVKRTLDKLMSRSDRESVLLFEVENELEKTSLDTTDIDLWRWASKIDSTGVDANLHVRILQQATLNRKIHSALQAGLRSHSTGDDLHAEVTEYLMGLESASTSGTIDMNQAAKEWLDYVEAMSKADTILSTGFKPFDDWGLIGEGSVMTIAGRPSMGKSALALWLALAWAKHGERIFWLSSETLKMKVLTRLCAQVGKFNSRHIAGTISVEMWRDITSAASTVSHLPIRINDTADRQAEIIREIRKQHKVFQPTVVIVDHIQECIENEEPRLETNKLISALRSACRQEPKMALVMVSQLSRKVEQRPLRIPTMSDLKESGKIEEASDSILFVTRPEYYRHQVEEYKDADPSLMLIDVAKNRDGETGRMKFVWNNNLGQVVGPRKEEQDI